MEHYELLSKSANLTETETNQLKDIISNNPLIEKVFKSIEKDTQKLEKAIKASEAYKESPYIQKSSNSISIRAKLDRDYIAKNEFGKKIDETHGTMFYFKERTKEFAHIASLDTDDMRMAFGEGMQNILEHGQGQYVEIELSINNINSDDVYLEMTFKHNMSSKQFYSIQNANKSADEGILNFECSRGRGEFLMRELMDERKFINGYQKDESGKKQYFFQRIMRKYKTHKQKLSQVKLTKEFKSYIDSLEDYHSALFVRMDYFTNRKELVISEETGNLTTIKNLMEKNGYTLTSHDTYRNTTFSFWESKDTEKNKNNDFELILNDLESIISNAKQK